MYKYISDQIEPLVDITYDNKLFFLQLIPQSAWKDYASSTNYAFELGDEKAPPPALAGAGASATLPANGHHHHRIAAGPTAAAYHDSR